MNASELLALIDDTVSDGRAYPTLDDYTRALATIHEVEERQRLEAEGVAKRQREHEERRRSEAEAKKRHEEERQRLWADAEAARLDREIRELERPIAASTVRVVQAQTVYCSTSASGQPWLRLMVTCGNCGRRQRADADDGCSHCGGPLS